MALTPGARIGTYEITAQIGAGGMGEVYQARDTKLNRDVALKVLPALVADDPDRLARFRREAQVLAALNHTNIAQIHGLEDAGPVPALIMELVDGPTLADLLEGGRRLPLSEALPIARQIAEALEFAHERGIIHRDLKPANIKVREDGTVKVLDFGLAKALTPEGSSETTDAMNSPTLTARATQLGVILGTAAYMAPEQAKGKHVDRRADIWAFGVVFYEMLAGRRGYEAEDVSETLAAVLMRDVEWNALPAVLPARLHALLRDCLVRDPKQRLRDIGEARRLLEQIINGAPEPAAPAATAHAPTRRGKQTLPWLVAGLAAATAGALALVHYGEVPPLPQGVQFQVPAPENSALSAFALSPDGRYLAFVAYLAGGSGPGEAQGSQLWLRALDSLDARPLAGTEGVAAAPGQVFWAPDSAFIGFVAQGRLKRVSINGGPPQTLATVPEATRAAWGRGDTIVLAPGLSAPLRRMPATGGVAVDITGAIVAMSNFQPEFLPDGRHFLYSVVGGTPEVTGVYVRSLDDGATGVRLLPDRTVAKYAPPATSGGSGHLLFVREATLTAQPFDVKTLALSGAAFPVAEAVGTFSVSQNGGLAYRMGGPGAVRRELAWVDRSGRPIATVAAPGDYQGFRLSPDERSVVFSRSEDGNSDIWALDIVRGVPSRITFHPGVDNLPIWSNDNLRILWPSNRGAGFNLYIKSATGTGEDEELIPMGTSNGWGTDWAADGKSLLFQRPGEGTAQDLWIAPGNPDASGGEQKPFPYLQSPFNERNGVFSPDGRWIAYESDESGRYEIYVRAFPLTSDKDQISTGGGADPAWNKSGGELFYLASNRNLMAVPYRAIATTFEPGLGKVLFPIPGIETRRSYAVSSDGRRFLIGKPLETPTPEPITVVVNWLAGLRR